MAYEYTKIDKCHELFALVFYGRIISCLNFNESIKQGDSGFLYNIFQKHHCNSKIDCWKECQKKSFIVKRYLMKIRHLQPNE